jgi:beta-lactam-binding protein with PASTA domain
VPAVTGMTSTNALNLLVAAGLKVAENPVFSRTVADGMVIGQEPAAGPVVNRGSTVILSVSSSGQAVVVPSVTGMTIDAARTYLEQHGFGQIAVHQQLSSGIRPGQVIRSEPPAGTITSNLEIITLIASVGPPPAPT